MKKNIAIVSGGFSSEVVVSEKSAKGIYSFIDKEAYNLYNVSIIGEHWRVEFPEGELYSIDKNDFSFTREGKKIVFDFAYIIIHGTPGEDGVLQGYFDLIGLPHSTCDVLCAALTFNKFFCNQYLKNFGIEFAKSVLLRKGETILEQELALKIGFPCFIKPNVGGSSFGITKVKRSDEVQPAISKAFSEGDEVMIEAFIEGTELTCGMYKTAEKSIVFPVTEVVTQNEFFDYDAKYNGQVEEITPARITDALTLEVQNRTKQIYEILACRGIVRIDYILTPEGKLNLLEVNTIPGMTPTSFIPQQVEAAGLKITDVMTDIIEDALDRRKKQ